MINLITATVQNTTVYSVCILTLGSSSWYENWVILVVTGRWQRLINQLTTIHLVAAVHSCWHGNADFLFHAHSDLLSDRGWWVLVGFQAMATQRLEVSRGPTVLVSNVAKNIISTVGPAGWPVTGVKSLTVETSWVGWVSRMVVWVAQVAVVEGQSLHVLTLPCDISWASGPCRNQILSFLWIIVCSEFYLIVKNSRVTWNGSNHLWVRPWDSLVLTSVVPATSDSVARVVERLGSDGWVYLSFAHHGDMRWRFTNLAVVNVTLITDFIHIVVATGRLGHANVVLNARDHHVSATATVDSAISVHSRVTVACESAIGSGFSIAMKIFWLWDWLSIQFCISAAALPIWVGGGQDCWLIQMLWLLRHRFVTLTHSVALVAYLHEMVQLRKWRKTATW